MIALNEHNIICNRGLQASIHKHRLNLESSNIYMWVKVNIHEIFGNTDMLVCV